MAIPKPLADFLCAENAWKPLPKSVLLLGRQTMPFGIETLEALAKKWNLSVGKVEFDSQTQFAKLNQTNKWITDKTFFQMLGVEHIRAIDHTDYEGADIILDLCEPIPPEYEGQFDFIFNGSVLDNVFDIASALLNIGRLLAPGGRVVHVETATTCAYSYSAISPSWFFDYATVNNWADCKVYMGTAGNLAGLTSGPWGMMAFDPTASKRPNAFTCDLGSDLGVQVIIGEKGEGSTWNKKPVQSHYRSDNDWAQFIKLVENIRSSRRPLHKGDGATGERNHVSPDGAWVNCGWW